jgi:hypothetical protein
LPGKAPSHPGGWPLNFRCGCPGRQILPRLDEVSTVQGIYLIHVHLTGVHLMGVYLTGVHFMGVYLINVHLARNGCESNA